MLSSSSQADPDPRPAGFAVPGGACDTHAHVFGPAAQYPYAADRQYTPPDASLHSYEHMLRVLGLERAVLVQPSVYGTDNRRLLDALNATTLEMRGIVVLPETVSDDELDAMHRVGVRGVRVNLLRRVRRDLDLAAILAKQIARLQWHLQVVADVSALTDVVPFVKTLPIETVFDHMGHVPAVKGVNEPGFRALLRQLDSGRCWVKLSGSYRLTQETHPPYGDVRPLARALIRTAPDRVVWGSDWPHTAIKVPMPNDGSLLDMLAEWAPDGAERHGILVRNPARLYGFEQS